MITRGFYKHYKGGLYYAFCNGKHSETTKGMVAYYSLYYRTWWFRPANMWDDVVKLQRALDFPTGYIFAVKRFEKITFWEAVKDYISYLCK